MVIKMSRHVYIIAEAGVNHNGNYDLARQLVEAGAEAGVDAVKFQTFCPEALVTQTASKAAYQKVTTDAAESQLEMLEKLTLRAEEYLSLEQLCRKKGVDFISTPFDSGSLRFLTEKMAMPFVKLPSGEITNAPFLLQAAQTGRKIVLSTGMATLGEIESALGVLAYGYLKKETPNSTKDFMEAFSSTAGQEELQSKVSLLHCTTQYPTPFDQVNLKAMETMQYAFQLPVGYSDHTFGIVIPIAAVARGASIIEKHFTLDRNLPGPDQKASLEPDELKEMVDAIRVVEQSIGTGKKIPMPIEQENRKIVRKSLVAVCPIKKGQLFTEKNVTTKRPGSGSSPYDFWNIIGKIAEKNYQKDELL